MSLPVRPMIPKQVMDRESFSAVVREHHAGLCAYARAITGDGVRAGEIVQDAFVAAWQNIGKFDVTRDISSWLRGIVRNKWRETCRRERREIAFDESALEALEQQIHQLEADRPEVFDRLARCRERLPQALAESITAYYDGQLSTEEAALQLQINGATLRKRLERARQALRDCLQGGPSLTQPMS